MDINNSTEDGKSDMITKLQACSLKHRDEVHYTGRHDCTRTVGPRGGVTENITVARVTGECKVWKREPERFHIGVVHGLRDFGSISNENNSFWHLPSDCPLVKTESEFVELVTSEGRLTLDGAAYLLEEKV